MTSYSIKNASDQGRIAAYNFIIARKKWPLSPEPTNPFEMTSADQCSAWEDAFRSTFKKHGGL